MTEPAEPARWLWITPEVRDVASTGALVYSMGLARAVAATPVQMTMIGVGAGVAPIDGIDLDLIPGELRGGWRSLISPLPNLAYATRLDDFVARVDAKLRESWDVVVIDGLQVAWASEPVAAADVGTVVFIAHNHEASLRRQVAAEASWRSGRRFALALDAWKAARRERRSAVAADIVTSITEEDRRRFAAEVPGTTHVTITPGWSGGVAHGGAAADSVVPMADRPRRIGMLGSLEWHVKQENLRRFVAAADPIFTAAEIELVVGGSVPEDFRREIESASRSVSLVGWIDDPAEFLASCRMGVIAEPLGGGFKLKSLDYVFNGVALACLTGNSTGLPVVAGESMVEASTLGGLAATIVDVIDDTDLLDRLAVRALDACRTEFSWERRAADLVAAVRTPR
jgi:glycosyltransferase involved in cell wall biosynthesis